MGKLTRSKIFLIHLAIHAIALSLAYAGTEPSPGYQPVEKWFKSLQKSMTPKFKVIELYVQDVRGNANQTVWEIARSNISSTSPTSFGELFLADSMITAKPEFNSLKLGQAQGLGGFSDLTVPALYLNYNIIFTTGKYRGSTVTVSGRNQVANPSSELSVVGGTGYFRLARGIAITANYAPRNALGISILKYTLYITYY